MLAVSGGGLRNLHHCMTHGICRTESQAKVERLAEGAAGLEIDSRF